MRWPLERRLQERVSRNWRALDAFVFCVAAVAGLVACADKPPAPIEDRSRPGMARVDQRYVVLPGDTLYAIAFRYGLDYRRLAAANRIPAPYYIFPGQRLLLREAAVSVVASPPQTASSRAVVTKPESPPGQSGAVAAPVVKASSNQAPRTPRVPEKAAARVTPATQKKSTAVGAASNVSVSRWAWPADGRLSRRFDADLHKGIDISGDRGAPVRATAAGSVAYAGSGIAGYGLMLIVRHNNEYLSAYGHNDRLLVEEGDAVTAGQPIAERGSSGTDTVKVHFEIRRLGRPVDPLTLLPPRKG